MYIHIQVGGACMFLMEQKEVGVWTDMSVVEGIVMVESSSLNCQVYDL